MGEDSYNQIKFAYLESTVYKFVLKTYSGQQKNMTEIFEKIIHHYVNCRVNVFVKFLLYLITLLYITVFYIIFCGATKSSWG